MSVPRRRIFGNWSGRSVASVILIEYKILSVKKSRFKLSSVTSGNIFTASFCYHYIPVHMSISGSKTNGNSTVNSTVCLRDNSHLHWRLLVRGIHQMASRHKETAMRKLYPCHDVIRESLMTSWHGYSPHTSCTLQTAQIWYQIIVV